MSDYKKYRKKGLQLMRPYVPGECLIGISVSENDMPEKGGMIAKNENDPTYRWYVNKEFFNHNYELVED